MLSHCLSHASLLCSALLFFAGIDHPHRRGHQPETHELRAHENNATESAPLPFCPNVDTRSTNIGTNPSILNRDSGHQSPTIRACPRPNQPSISDRRFAGTSAHWC